MQEPPQNDNLPDLKPDLTLFLSFNVFCLLYLIGEY